MFSEPCPRCRRRGGDKSGNNLAAYSDGHKYCYACGFFVPSPIESRLGREPTITKTNDGNYFNRSGLPIPNPAYRWLKNYGLDSQEIDEYYFWDERGYLVFDGGTWQCGRNFGRGPKYNTKGIVKGNEIVFMKEMTDDGIVLVEDVISGLKVSKVLTTCPIMGCVIPLELLQRLSKRFSTCYIWLDPDKQKESFTEADKARLYFKKVVIIWANKDPKEHTIEEIKEKLNVSRRN